MPETLRSWLSQGPFTLSLCSSFFGFYSHCAATHVLYDLGLIPHKVTGSSAGALVAAALASGMTPPQFKDLIFSIERNHFWDPQLGFGLLKGEKFLQILRQHLAPDFASTTLLIEIATWDIFAFKTHFLNQGSLPEAVVASCAVPGLFHPQKIQNRFYYDGGIINKSGVSPTDRHCRVLNIFLESQGPLRSYKNKIKISRGPQHRTLYFSKIPLVNIHKLESGKTAFAEIFDRTQKIVDQPFEQNILRA